MLFLTNKYMPLGAVMDLRSFTDDQPLPLARNPAAQAETDAIRACWSGRLRMSNTPMLSAILTSYGFH